MDQDRQIRFAIPPFFLFASLLWGAHIAGRDLSALLKPENAKEMFGLLAATAVALVPMGFLISTLSIILLRCGFCIFGKPTYEATFDNATLNRVWAHLRMPGASHKRFTLYAAATYDHELLSEGVHLWLFRRWTSFNVAIHSIVALVLAHAVAPAFEIPQDGRWWATTVGLVALFVISGTMAWREVMTMLEFQSHRTHTKPATQKGEAD